MNHKIHGVTKWLLQVGSGESIIAANNDVMLFCNFGKLVDIYTLNRWIGRSFEVKHFNTTCLNDLFCFIQITQINNLRLDV